MITPVTFIMGVTSGHFHLANRNVESPWRNKPLSSIANPFTQIIKMFWIQCSLSMAIEQRKISCIWLFTKSGLLPNGHKQRKTTSIWSPTNWIQLQCLFFNGHTKRKITVFDRIWKYHRYYLTRIQNIIFSNDILKCSLMAMQASFMSFAFCLLRPSLTTNDVRDIRRSSRDIFA